MAGTGKRQAFVRAQRMAHNTGQPAYVVYDTLDKGVYAVTTVDLTHEKLIGRCEPTKKIK